MPRKHQKAPGSRPYANWSEETLQTALAEIQTGTISYRDAQDKYNIPKSTLQRKIKNKHMKKVGRPTELDSEEEIKLVDGLIILADWGYPVSHLELRLLVKSYLDSLGMVNLRFQDNLPGEEWCVSFLERHKSRLTTRLCSNIKRARSELSREQLTEYFVNLEESLIGVTPDNIINFDETNMSDDPGRKKVLIKRGSKRADRIIDFSKSSTSVMFAGTATGVLLPLYVVYKAEHMHSTWTQGGRPGTRYNRSRSGWFDSVLFEDFFDTVIIKYFEDIEKAKEEKCLKLIIGDNLSSHVSLSVIKKCQEHGIRFVFMPPNATHLCQPLDVAFFRALKQSWRNKLTEWKLQNRGVVPKDIFPRLLKNALTSMGDNIKTNIISGFKAAGIHPCDPNSVLKKIPQEPRQNASSDAHWSDVFLDYLKKGREKPSTQRQKRRRLNVAPGKSVTETDFDQPSTSNQVLSNAQVSLPPNEIEHVACHGSDNESTFSSESEVAGDDPLTVGIERDIYFDTDNNYNQSDHGKDDQIVSSQSIKSSVPEYRQMMDSVEVIDETYLVNENLQHDMALEEPQKVTGEENKENEKELRNNDIFKVDNFILVNLVYNENTRKPVTKYFVAKILSTQPEGILCKFLRKSKKTADTFIYPPIDDDMLIQSKDVVRILMNPTINRGRHVFKDLKNIKF